MARPSPSPIIMTLPLTLANTLRHAPCRHRPRYLPLFRPLSTSPSTTPPFIPPYHADALSTLPSHADPSSPTFQSNLAAQTARLSHLETLTRAAQAGGSPAVRAKHLAGGRLLPRDRITALLDPGTAFLELSPLAGHELYEDTGTVAGGGIITGIGQVEGVTCMVVANDSTVKGGTYFPITVKKHLRAQEIARENHLPCIYLVDSGGANLPHQADVFPDRDHFGRIFYNQARMSAAGIPQIAVVLGPCTAGGAYVPAMSDETIIVDRHAHVFLAGPPLVRAATGESVSAEDLGGGRMHCTTSGVTDHLAVDDAHACVLARRCVRHLNWPVSPSLSSSRDDNNTNIAPLYPGSDLLGLIPPSLRHPFPMHAIIARLVDRSLLSEFKPLYGPTLITGFAHIHGHAVGIVANTGVLVAEAACKGAHFIELCAQRGVPLVFLQNISGFMVGREAERGGIAKHGAKLVAAVAGARVPKLTVVVGGSYGAGNYGMCGRAYGPRFLWMWPMARIGVMGGEQLATVMGSLAEKKKTAKGGEEIEEARRKMEEKTEELRARIERESDALYSTARLWDDGIIPPHHTRRYLALGLNAALGGRNQVRPGYTKFGVFRM